jgi:peptide/nickel transport system substrate-binding protein
MDPYFGIGHEAHGVHRSIGEALVNRFGVPLLAESWEIPDELTWRFHLRKGVKFHSGNDFTAEAVKHAFERFTDPDQPARWATDLRDVDHVEVVDDYTIDFKTKVPFATLYSVLYNVLVLDPEVVESLGENLASSLEGAGTGPFKFVEWVPGERAVMEANEEYWGGVPKLKTVIYRPIPEPSVRVTEVKTGGVHIAIHVPPQSIPEVEEAPGVHIETVESIGHYEITYNIHKPPFNDARVRLALNYAINREELIEFVLFGIGKVPNGPLSPPYEGHNPDLEPWPYDPDKAKELLAEAGYADGLDITIISPSGRHLQDKELAEAIAGQLSKVGVNMTVKALEWVTYLKTYNQEGHGFLILATVWPTHAFLTRHFDSRRQDFVWYGYHNEQVNELLDRAAATFDDAERIKIWQEVDKIGREEAIFLDIADMMEVSGVSDKVEGFEPPPDDVYTTNHTMALKA